MSPRLSRQLENEQIRTDRDRAPLNRINAANSHGHPFAYDGQLCESRLILFLSDRAHSTSVWPSFTSFVLIII
jgi:hypothetical protein